MQPETPHPMTVLDTDVFSEILRNNPCFVRRAAAIPAEELAITVITVEELLRGRLARVREAQSRRDPDAVVSAYHWLAETVEKLAGVAVVRDSSAAEERLRAWREAKVRVKPNDLRVAAIVAASGATLVSRNRRDFALVPGLAVEFWD